jgi:GNAT superfamily N-acetyltransferase
MSEPVIELMGSSQIERLRPLWLELLAHHEQVSPEFLPPAVDAETSWRRRRAMYVEWLAEPDAFALIAVAGDEIAGYAIVAVQSGDELGDTWTVGDRVAELETLVVSLGHRSKGVGTQLLDRVESELRSRGIREMIIAAVATNEAAIRFYERRGYRPYLTYLYGNVNR